MIYAIIAAVVLAIGGGAGYAITADHWEAKYKALQAADALDRANGEAVIAKTLQNQLIAAQTVSQNNAQTIQRLQSENEAIAADRDANLALAHRLLAHQTQSPANSFLPKAGSGSIATHPSPASPDADLAQLLVNVGSECDQNANQLNALIAEIKPQL